MAFDQSIADRILGHLAEGMSLRKASAAESMSPRTILDWVDANPAFSAQYAQVRARSYSMLAEEILEISDDGTNDTYMDDNGLPKVNTDVIARSKLRVDSRKWILSKMLPKVYGDKLAIGGDADNPLTVTVQRLSDGAA